MKGKLKTAFRAMVVVALIHAFTALGFGAYLVGTGRLNKDRFKTLVELLRTPVSDEAKATDENTSAADQTMQTETTVPSEKQQEIQRLHAERVQMQASHQMMLANRLRMELDRAREEFAQQIASQTKQQKESEEQVAAAGFEKELEELSLMKPKIAVDRLLTRPVDDAARLLMAMDTRSSKKIVEAAHKEPRKWALINVILDRTRELNAGGEGESNS